MNNPINLRDPLGLLPGYPGGLKYYCMRPKCIAEGMYEFIKCLGELIYDPGPMNPSDAVGYCTICFSFLQVGVFEPASCAVCLLGVGNYGFGLFDCARRGDAAQYACCKRCENR